MVGSPCSSAGPPPPDNSVYTPKSKRDVLFVIDESASVGDGNFQRFTTLARTIVNNAFCGDIGIGEDKTRVGVLSFDSKQHLHLDLKTSYVKSNVLRRMQNINFNHTTSGFTCIGETLRYAIRDALTVGHGARTGDGDTEQIVILLSDGCAYCKSPNQRVSDVKLMSEEFSRNGVVVINFLVGSHSDECIEEMKALIDGTRCYQLFEFKDWDEVEIAIKSLQESQCPNTWPVSQC